MSNEERPWTQASGLTLAEFSVMNHLAAAWNRFVKLPDHGSDDIEDFRRAMHRLQDLMALRAMRRKHPEYWR
jgi:hypothetical protein